MVVMVTVGRTQRREGKRERDPTKKKEKKKEIKKAERNEWLRSGNDDFHDTAQ